MGELSSLLLYLGSSFFTEMAFLLTALALLDYPIPWKKVLLLTVLVDVTVSPALFVLIMSFGERVWMLFLGDLTGILFNALVVYLFFERDKARMTAAVCIGHFCYYQVYMGTFVAIPVVGSLLSGAACLLLCWLLGKLFRRLRVSDSLEYFMRDRGQKRILIAACLSLAASYYLYYFGLNRWLSSLSLVLPYQTWVLVALFLALMLYITFYARHRQREEMQEMMLVQQQMYIESLEELQREVRMYRHDYKNLVAGLLLHVREGNLEAVSEFLNETAGNFDEAVGKRIAQTTQLVNLRQSELKSLVLSKLVEMQKLGIRCRLEVAYPVEKVNMNILDLNRCLGILLDNAIEETKEQQTGEINLVFLNGRECLTILVGNSLREGVDLKAAFREGYSTKGKGRGVGLASFERIVRKYRNVTVLTSVKNRELVQELKIS